MGRPHTFPFLPWSTSAFPLAFLSAFHTEIHGKSLLLSNANANENANANAMFFIAGSFVVFVHAWQMLTHFCICVMFFLHCCIILSVLVMSGKFGNFCVSFLICFGQPTKVSLHLFRQPYFTRKSVQQNAER